MMLTPDFDSGTRLRTHKVKPIKGFLNTNSQ